MSTITDERVNAEQFRDLVRVPAHREPTHPGQMLLKEFLEPLELTQRELATAINVPYQRVNELINGKRGITASTALKLGKFFGMSPQFWLHLQISSDLYRAQRSEAHALRRIKPLAPQPAS